MPRLATRGGMCSRPQGSFRDCSQNFVFIKTGGGPSSGSSHLSQHLERPLVPPQNTS